MKYIGLIILLIIAFCGCEEEAQPYEEVNSSMSNHQEGYIDTH